MAKRSVSPRFLTWAALAVLASLPQANAACSRGHYARTTLGIKDLASGLTWAPCLAGLQAPQCRGTAKALTFSEALAVESASPGWRLPTHDELLALVQPDCAQVHINTTYFGTPGQMSVWTNTPGADGDKSYWTVNFNAGFDDIVDRSSANTLRLVRMPTKP